VCRQCGRFLQWLSTKGPPPDDAEITIPQMSYLVDLGFVGTFPLTKREASALIQARLRERQHTEAP
jgi:hypothetical protein